MIIMMMIVGMLVRSVDDDSWYDVMILIVISKLGLRSRKKRGL